jgi:hypothetical protein
MEGALAGRPWNVLLLGSFLEGLALAGQDLGGGRPWVRAFGKLDLSTTAAVLMRLPLTLGYEGDWVHLACALGKPHVLIAGGGAFGVEYPYSPWTTTACKPIECFGCAWQCRHAALHCLEELAPATLAAAVAHAMAGPAERPKVVYSLQPTAPGVPQAVDLPVQAASDPVQAIELLHDPGRA